MTLDQYQQLAMRTSGLHNTLVNAALGLCGEAGEFADLIKKHEFHGHELSREKAKAELGDVFWYLALGAARLGFTLDEIGVGNISKLQERYPDGFSVEASKHRSEP